MDKRIDAALASHPEREGGHVSYPGERTLSTRKKSMEQGVTVDEQIWQLVSAIAEGNLEAADSSNT